MGRIKNPELFLLPFQLCTDDCQEKEQDENPGGNRPENTRRRMAHAVQGRGLHRHLSAETGRIEKSGRTDLTT